MSPIEVPLIGVLVIGGFLASLSRVLLAVPENGARVIAIAVAAAILLVAFLIAYRPKIGSSVLAALLAIGAVALIAAGIAGGVAGERTIEKPSTSSAGK
jgi:peptidoglycan/LPS O-acetylase OafA/YrhL